MERIQGEGGTVCNVLCVSPLVILLGHNYVASICTSAYHYVYLRMLQVECDRLQRVHTLENLAWLVEQGHCSPGDLSGPLRDASALREKVGTHADMMHTNTLHSSCNM